MEIPIFKTKIKGLRRKFNLTDPRDWEGYFEAKAGGEIKKLRGYLKENTFVAYLLGKKISGKGTYSKMFGQVVDPERVEHFSIGDMARALDQELADSQNKEKLKEYLEKNYRGFSSLETVWRNLEQRSTRTLLPTELILTLVKREMARREKKALFIDGFPRNLDQISYSLFFRDLIGYREDPDVFILIDVPHAIIEERMKWRRFCPKCQTSRNLNFLPTSKIGFDERSREFFLVCDNPPCQGARLEKKEGDELGLAPVLDRLKEEERMMKQALSLHGIPKVFLRNSVPRDQVRDFCDDYELTPEYRHSWDEEKRCVITREIPWVILDDEGRPSQSLLAPAITLSLIHQLVEVLNL